MLDTVASQVQVNARRVVMLQIIIAIAVAIVFGIVESAWSAISVVYGGLISISISLLLRRGVLKANDIAKDDPKRGMTMLYLGALQRFVMVLALLVLGLGVFKMTPLATVIGFGAAQVAYAIVMRRTAHPERR